MVNDEHKLIGIVCLQGQQFVNEAFITHTNSFLAQHQLCSCLKSDEDVFWVTITRHLNDGDLRTKFSKLLRQFVVIMHNNAWDAIKTLLGWTKVKADDVEISIEA